MAPSFHPRGSRRAAAEGVAAIFSMVVMLPVFGACGSNQESTPMGRGGSVISGAGGTFSLTDPNVVEVTVDPGAQGLDRTYTNGLFVTATLCVPGTSNCQSIDHLLLDTGSVGVRVLSSELTLPLPSKTSAAGLPLVGCTPFVDGVAWGAIEVADVKVGGEIASGISVQAIGGTTYPVPATCKAKGDPILDLHTLGAKGVFGIGIHLEDCGISCLVDSAINPGNYYACTSNAPGGCVRTTVPLASQVANPVGAFPVDNNGTIIQLPVIPDDGAAMVTGTLAFGIGTQPNNGLGAARVLQIDRMGFATTTFPAGGGAVYNGYIDSGSNGLFFLDSAISHLQACTGDVSQFYCPGATKKLGASMTAQDGGEVPAAFNVADASTLPPASCAFSDLAGPMPGYLNDASVPGFDWGLPFYFGRTVFTALEDRPAPGGASPYFAF